MRAGLEAWWRGVRPIGDWPLAWIYAPKLTALGFSVRTTLAALFALAIALWMELGDPQWAPMTVWIVALGSRGESLSKGRWRIVGTVLGMVAAVTLIAAMPQAPWLFFPALALWTGLCAGLATLVRNFRSYAFVLAAYTCAIIAMDSTAHPDSVFQTAMSRGTYILLGVICEMVAGMVFTVDLAAVTRVTMRGKLVSAIGRASMAAAGILRGEPPSEASLRGIFSLTLSLNDQIEFSAVELQQDHRWLVRCAYATLGLLSRAVSRTLGMKSRLAAVGTRSALSSDVIADAAAFLTALPNALATDADVRVARIALDGVRDRCRHAVAATMDRREPEDIAVNDRVALLGLDLLLHEFAELLRYFEADRAEQLTPERYRLRHALTWRNAMSNGTRSTVAILLAGLIWEVTAWPQGGAFVAFVSVICGRFAAFENTVLASNAFFYGACWAAVATILPVFVLMPLATNFEGLALILFVPMFLGGLASRNPRTALGAGAYNVFFPALLGLGNQARIQEIQWFNGTPALLLGLLFGVLVFKCVLPFDERRVCALLRARVLAGVRRIGGPKGSNIDENRWIGHNTQGMERLIRYGGSKTTPLVDAYLHGTLALMTVGRNLMHLHHVITDPDMPVEAAGAVRAAFEDLSHRDHGARGFVAIAGQSLALLRQLDTVEAGAAARLAVTQAIGALAIVTLELRENANFFDGRPTFANEAAALQA